VAVRLRQYGVKEENIVLTGFPLPREFTKNNAAKAKKDLKRRLQALDPEGKYLSKYGTLAEKYVGSVSKKHRRPVLTFAIGGAGAQAELAEDIIGGVKPLVEQGMLEFHIIAGVHKELASTLKKKVGRHMVVHFSSNKAKYFSDFAKILSKTDILWTKPSELVFYAGLGLPLILAPPIGSQEKMNRKWLLEVGAAIDQKKPELTYQWLPDLIKKGTLAEAAMQGFVEIEKNGTENIKRLVCGS